MESLLSELQSTYDTIKQLNDTMILGDRYSLRASDKKLVKKSNRKGYAHVICSDMEAPGSCCNWAPDVDTLIRFDYQKFDQSDFK